MDLYERSGHHGGHHHHDGHHHGHHRLFTGDSLTHLWPRIQKGITAIAVLATLSLITTTALFFYLTVKLFIWRFVVKRRRTQPQPANESGDAHEQHLAQTRSNDAERKTKDFVLGIDGVFTDRSESGGEDETRASALHKQTQTRCSNKLAAQSPNQFLILIYNLLLADMHQAAAFALDMAWLVKDGVYQGTAECWTQGLLVSTGDLASSAWVTTIAVHTLLSITRGYQPAQKTLYIIIFCVWAFIYLMSVVPIAATRNGASTRGYFVPAGAWCWVNAEYDAIRIATHYVWLFVGIGATSIIYIYIFIYVRRQARMRKRLGEAGSTSQSPQLENSTVFLLYPLIYVCCTLPVAVGRIGLMAEAHIPLSYFCSTGVLLAMNGFFDCLLFSFTRKSIIYSSAANIGVKDTGLSTFSFLKTPRMREYGNMVWIQGGRSRDGTDGTTGRRWPWQRLAGSSGPTGHANTTRSASQESLRDQSIRMDMMTSVVVEQHDPELSRWREATTPKSVGSSEVPSKVYS